MLGEDRSDRGCLLESTDDIEIRPDLLKAKGSFSNSIDEQLNWLEKELSLVKT
jgi:hypothetical protein